MEGEAMQIAGVIVLGSLALLILALAAVMAVHAVDEIRSIRERRRAYAAIEGQKQCG